MPEVGQILHKAREDKGVDLKEVERQLKIRRKFLIAFENGQPLGDLGDIYIKGFLRNYSVYLDLDPDEILQMYGSGPHAAPSPQPQIRQIPSVPASRSAAGANPGKAERSERPHSQTPIFAIIAGAVLVISLLAFGAVSVARNSGSQAPAEATVSWALTQVIEASEAISSTLEAELTPQGTATSTSTPTKTSTPTPTPTVTLTPTPEFYTGVNIELLASAKAWTQIRVDGRKVFEGMLEPGMRKSWRGEDRVEVRCGNAGGVEAFVNGESIGLLGEEGQVVDMEWQKEKGPPPQSSPSPVVPTATSVGVSSELTPTLTLESAPPETGAE